MVSSLMLYSLALFMLSLSHKNSYYQVFLTHGVALGLASGLSYVPSLGIASHYFHRRRPLAMGIVSSGSALGAIIHPIMLNRLFNGPVGFHNGVRISAAMNTCLLAIACLLMETRLPPRELKHFPVWEWLKEPGYFAILVAGCWTFLGLFFPVFYLQLDAVLHGVDKNVAFYSLSVLSAASFIGRIIPGGLATKFGVFNLLVLFTMATGVITLSMLGVHNNASTLIFSVFYGIFSGGAISLLAPTVGLLSKDMSEIGARLGILFGIGGILGLVATPIAGALLTNQHHWTRAILFAGISLVIAGFSYAASRYFVAKKKGTQLI
jgi:MFS family permease